MNKDYLPFYNSLSEEEKAELEELYENSEWWHNRFNAVQRDYEELTKRNKELEDGFKASIEELSEYATKIDKATEWVHKHILKYNCKGITIIDWDELSNPNDLLKILGDKENE